MLTRFRRWLAPHTPQTAAPKLSLEALEAREVPAAVLQVRDIAVAHTGGAADSTVQFLNTLRFQVGEGQQTITPFAGYRGELAVALGDVNGDGRADTIAVAQGAGGHVKVFDGATGALLQSFLAFSGFGGPVSAGAADVNGDGFGDVLVASNGVGGHVKAVSGKDGSLLASFRAFPGFEGRVSVSGGDIDRDGLDDIIVGAGGAGANGRVAVFSAAGAVLNSGVSAFPGFDGEISVAGGDLNGDGVTDVTVTANGHVKTFSGADFGLLYSFMAFAPADFTRGSSVAVGDTNFDGKADIIVTAEGATADGVWLFDGTTGAALHTRVEQLGADGSPATVTTTTAPSQPVPSASATRQA